MLKPIPEIKTKVANETLAPYFKNIYAELMAISAGVRETRIRQYTSYIEGFAQKKSTPVVVRMQLRINLKALLEKLGEVPERQELTVKAHNRKLPKFGDEAYYEVPTEDLDGFSITSNP